MSLVLGRTREGPEPYPKTDGRFVVWGSPRTDRRLVDVLVLGRLTWPSPSRRSAQRRLCRYMGEGASAPRLEKGPTAMDADTMKLTRCPTCGRSVAESTPCPYCAREGTIRALLHVARCHTQVVVRPVLEILAMPLADLRVVRVGDILSAVHDRTLGCLGLERREVNPDLGLFRVAPSGLGTRRPRRGCRYQFIKVGHRLREFAGQ